MVEADSTLTTAPAAEPKWRRRKTFNTTKSIQALAPKATAYDAFDARKTGLVLRTHPSGTKSWRWNVTALRHVASLGPWSSEGAPGHLTLEQARAALDRLKKARLGGLVELQKAEADLKASLSPAPLEKPVIEGRTVRRVAEQWFKVLESQRKRPQEPKEILELHFLSFLGDRALHSITKTDVVGVVRRVVDAGHKAHGGKVLALVKQFLDFAEGTEENFENPAFRLKAAHLGVVNGVRSRWLSEAELPVFIRAMEEKPPVAGVFVAEEKTRVALHLLLLLGLRSQELRLSRWEHVDFEAAVLTVPVSSQKLTKKMERTARPFRVPLGPTVVKLFRQLEAEKRNAWVLSSGRADEDGPYTDKVLGRAMRRLWRSHPELSKLPEASPHDLRRTCRTHLGRLGVPIHIAESCLNHRFGRVVQVYDHHDYLDERRDALERWDRYLVHLVHPETTNVVPLVAGAR